MLRQRRGLPFLAGLRVWLAVALLAIAAILLYTNLASAKQKSTERTLSAPARAVAGEDPVELSWDAVTGAQRSKLSASTSVDAQQQQDLDPVYITTLRPPADGSKQAIVMPRSVTVSEDDPWFGPFYTLNDPDRSVSIDILNDYGFIAAYAPNNELCNIPNYVSSSLAMGYQTAASNGFYVRRCPGFEHLASMNLRVTTYPDAEVYTTHRIRVISRSDPTPTTSARTATPTATPTAAFTATPTATLEANAPATATPTATPLVMTLSVPTLTAVGGESAVQLSWTTVSGAVRYELWTWTSAGGFQQLDDGALTGTTYSHAGLTAGTTYYYWVRAVNGSGEMSAWSERTSATVAAAPSIVVPTPTSTPTSTVSSLSKPVLTAEAGESAVQLTWTAVTGAERYVLMAWTSADGWQQIGGDNLTSTNYSHTGLTVGTTYFYAVRAVNAAGQNSPFSQYLTVAVPAAPASESDLSVPMLIGAPAQGRVVLNWSGVPNAARYELWVWDSVNEWRQIGGDTLTGTTYTHTNVTTGTTYYFAIRTVNANGETSAWSQYVHATIPAP